jgi:hypothetical protein
MTRHLTLGARTLLTVALLVVWQGGTAARADTILGVFSDPVLTGSVLNFPSLGAMTYENNTTTADVSISPDGSTITWGVDPGSGLPAGEQYSQLTFSGTSGLSVPGGPYEIGNISYLNGTSALNSLIFGATLSFYDNTVSPATWLASDSVIITTTSNQYSGLGLTQAQLNTDADYINICGNASNICGSSLEAYEDSEGGVGVVADLNGTIDGLTLNGITLDANQPSGGVNGSIGNELPLGEVPEPSAFVMFSTVLAICIGSRRTLRRAIGR